MNDCISGDTKWDTARKAIRAVTTDNSDEIRFGLQPIRKKRPEALPCTGICDYRRCTGGCDWHVTCASYLTHTACSAAAACRWRDGFCNNYTNFMTGEVNVPVADSTSIAINEDLTDNFPGGGTPTGRTLLAVHNNLSGFGLTGGGRSQYIMLVTDGDANGTVDLNLQCPNNTDDDVAQTNCALDRLNTINKIKTYVVGFAGGSTENLNCHAVNAGTSTCATPADCAKQPTETACTAPTRNSCVWREGTCTGVAACAGHLSQNACLEGAGCNWAPAPAHCAGGVDSQNCSDMKSNTGIVCYYKADNETDLLKAFNTIAGQIGSCSFKLELTEMMDAAKTDVYLDYRCDKMTSSMCPGTTGCTWNAATNTCSGDLIRLIRDNPDGWSYTLSGAAMYIQILGTSCLELKKAVTYPPVPRIVCGCAAVGGRAAAPGKFRSSPCLAYIIRSQATAVLTAPHLHQLIEVQRINERRNIGRRAQHRVGGECSLADLQIIQK